MNKKLCQHIDLAVKFSKLSGNPVKEVSTAWSKVKKVFYMAHSLTPELKNQIEEEVPTLKYWEATKDSHYAPEEGFICNECKESIAFPVKR